MMVDIGSVCTYCGVGCDITAKVKDNKIEKIYAQTDGHVSRGKLCIKGKNGYHFVHSEDRLKDVMIKKSFIKDNFEAMPRELKARSHTLQPIDDVWFKSSYEFATSLVAWKLSEININMVKIHFSLQVEQEHLVRALILYKNLHGKLCNQQI